MDVKVNFIAILLAMVSSVAVGMVWYHPKTLGGPWLKLAKIDPKKGNMAVSMASVFISGLMMAFVLAHMAFIANNFYGNSFLYDTLLTAFWMWLGFQGLRMFMHDQFNQRKYKETLIHMGNDLVTIMLMAVIIGAMGVK